MKEIDLKVADEVAKNANEQISVLNEEILKYKKERRFVYVIGLCFIFVLVTAFVLTALKFIDLTIVNEIQISKFFQNILSIPMYFINMFFIFSLVFKKLNKRLWICIFICTALSVVLPIFIPETYGIIASGIIPVFCILITGVLFYKKIFGAILFRLGLFTFIIAIYQQISRFIKLSGFGFDLFQCNIIVSIIYSIDLYLLYLLLLKVVKNNELVGTVEIPFRFGSFLKETREEILKNRQMIDVSDLETKRQRHVFSFLCFAYAIIQYAVIIGANVLINSLFNFSNAFLVGFIELIVAAVTLELFRLVLGKTFHSDKPKICNIVSFVVFFIISRFAMPLHISLFFNICVAALIALIIHIIVVKNDEYVNLKEEREKREIFSLDTCTEEQLRFRCRERNIKPYHADFAVDAFINQMTAKQLMSAHGYEESAAKTLKHRLKIKLK